MSSKRCLIILSGLKIGGVETYMCRLTKMLAQYGVESTVLVLTRKSDPSMVAQMEEHARLLWIDQLQYIRGHTSWLNAFFPLKGGAPIFAERFDYVHVVDSLSLHFFAHNHLKFNYASMTIGLYHEREFFWWNDQNVGFRQQQIALARGNAGSILFPNEIVRRDFLAGHHMPEQSLPLVPLGIELEGRQSTARQDSLKIVSIGRLVNFKTYNQILIAILPALRQVADFRYEIYGGGPLEAQLRKQVLDLGLDGCVTFHGEIAPDQVNHVIDGAFCFVGSGTTIIMASARGVPSVVGIESNPAPTCGGLFSAIRGYSYNEPGSHAATPAMLETILALHRAGAAEYRDVCALHIEKAMTFDIRHTARLFLDSFTAVLHRPERFHSRLRCAVSAIVSLLPVFGPGMHSFKNRYYKK